MEKKTKNTKKEIEKHFFVEDDVTAKNSQRKKNDDSLSGSHLEPRSKEKEENKRECKSVHVDNPADTKEYTVHCIDCLNILGISKECLFEKEIRCLKCAKKDIKKQKEIK